jgi:hypothetical protein
MLQSHFRVHTELLGSDLRYMTSSQVEDSIKPLREVCDSLQSWLVRVGSFLKQAEVALQRLSFAPTPLDEVGVELFASLSARVGSNSTPPVLSDFEGETSAKVVSDDPQV